MNTDDNLTVLLMLKDRVPFTWRWLNYANETRFPFKILIADGGKDRSVERILSGPSAFPNLNYEYVRYPYDATLSDYQAKVFDALGSIDTPFVALACNDDFYCAEEMRRSVEFLAENPDFSAARGAIYNFSVCSRQGAYRKHRKICGQFQWGRNQYPVSVDITGETAIERMQQVFNTPRSARVFEMIHRTTNLKDIFGVCTSKHLADFRYIDLLMAYMTIALGKVKHSPAPSVLIQCDTPGGAGLEMISWHATEAHWMCADNWPDMFSNWLDGVAGVLSRVDEISMDSARSFVTNRFLTGQMRETIADLLPSKEKQSRFSGLSYFKKWPRKIWNKLAQRFSKPVPRNCSNLFPDKDSCEFVQGVADYLLRLPEPPCEPDKRASSIPRAA